MKRVHLLVGAVAVTSLAGCVAGPARSANPLMSNADPHRDLATNEQFPLRSSAVKEEVDRQFEAQYPGTMNWLYVWGKDRWFDLMDVVSWDLSAGRGLGVNLRATDFVEVGVNWWEGMSWGQRGRAFGVWESDEEDRGVGPFYWVELERTPTWGTKTLFDHEYKYTGWDWQEPTVKANRTDRWDFGATVHLVGVGANAGLSPAEAFDFLAGLVPVGLVANVAGYHHPIFDIMDDDTHSQIEQQLRSEKGLGQ